MTSWQEGQENKMEKAHLSTDKSYIYMCVCVSVCVYFCIAIQDKDDYL